MDIENLKAKWEERIRRVGGAYSKQSVVSVSYTHLTLPPKLEV